MAIDYTVGAFNIKCKVLSISKIAKMTKTTDRDGTAPKAVENVNEFLRKAKPPISVRYHEGGKFPEIEKEVNEKNLPVIVLLNQVPLPKRVWHSVVVVDYDPENHMVFFDDPEEDDKNCIQSLEVGDFTRKWGWQARWVQVLLSKGQTYIDGYANNRGLQK
jgi:hypothetical protein